jgi:periplasmic divalent cation tolerance protein
MILILSAYPDRRSAEKAAMDLVERHLAACASVLPVECSVYRWKGRVERHSERLLIIKTGKGAYGAVERRIRETHPYDVPEIAYINVDHGAAGYLNWVESTSRMFRAHAASGHAGSAPAGKRGRK